jgi:signal transduction histidine kinase
MFAKVLRSKLIGDADGLNPVTVEAFTLEESLDFIGMSCKSLTECLDTLLEVTQIKLNNELQFDDCVVSELIGELVGQLHGVIFEKKAEIRSQLDVEVIKYPRVYLESILYNFISNALKYSKPDRPPEITVRTFVENGRLALSVMDNGLGLDIKKYGKKVFLLNQVFHEGYDSKGIGLYITKTQVESLGGRVEVKSAVNEGSEFIVWF